jgi:hypothetical protein
MAQKLLELYFRREERVPLVEKVLTFYSTQRVNQFFKMLEDYISNPHHTPRVLRLLTSVTAKQGAHVDKIADSKCLKALCEVLRTTTELCVLGQGVMILTMVLPVIPSQVPKLLPAFMRVLFNAMTFPALPRSVQQQMEWFLKHIYGMYPKSFTAHLEEMNGMSPQILAKMEPLLCQMRFNTGLLSKIEDELKVDRWRNKEPYEIVAKCLEGEYLDFVARPHHGMKDVDVYELYQSLDDPAMLPNLEDNDLGALSREGQKILHLQDLIEQKILSRPLKDGELCFSPDQLEPRLILLRNELIFERYLQRQYLRR